jgi:four helix bundle protein
MMQTGKENLIVSLTFEFSLLIIEYTELLESKRKYTLANQLFKSGTSIGANVREAQNAESKNDFIHKMKISAKETDETEYWLKLCKASPSYPDTTILLEKIESINKVLSKIIASSKKDEVLKTSSNYQITKSSN